MSTSNDGGGCGCFSFLVFAFVIWALAFGISLGGTHYSVAGCSCNEGVVITEKPQSKP